MLINIIIDTNIFAPLTWEVNLEILKFPTVLCDVVKVMSSQDANHYEQIM